MERGGGAVERGTHRTDPARHPDANGALVDPVCGMRVAPDAPHGFEHGGVTYRFCGSGCLERFREDPERWLASRVESEPGRGEAPGASRGRPLYTCPMHPEILQEGPGDCPICGMALEPVVGRLARP